MEKTVSITKVQVDGKSSVIQNPVNLAKLTRLMTGSVGKGKKNLLNDTQFIHDCKTGAGVYHLIQDSSDDEKSYHAEYMLDKKNIDSAVQAIRKCADLQEQIENLESVLEKAETELRKVIPMTGTAPQKGRKASVTSASDEL